MVFPCQAMGLWGILWFLIFLGKSWGQEQRYVISAPEVFHVGTPENIAIQAHGYTEAFTATVSIKSYPDGRIKYSSDSVNLSPENSFQNSAILTIQPMQLSEGENSASYVYLEIVSKHFSKLKLMPVMDTNGSVSNHADKLLHTPHHSDYQIAKRLTRVRRDLEKELKQSIQEQAAKYRHPTVKTCCYNGARLKNIETCQERAALITTGPRCVRAFTDCCVIANMTRNQSSFKQKHFYSTRGKKNK